MKYYSTNRQSPDVTFLKAAEQGLAPDGGLYMPHSIPILNLPFDTYESELTLQKIAKICSTPFLDEDLNEEQIDQLIKEAIILMHRLFSLMMIFLPLSCFMDQHWRSKISEPGLWQGCFQLIGIKHAETW